MVQGLGPRDLLAVLADIGATISSASEPRQLLCDLVTAWSREACPFAAAYVADEERPVAVGLREGFEASALVGLPVASLDSAAARGNGIGYLHHEPLVMKGRRIGTLVLGFTEPLDETVRAAVRTVASLTAASIHVAESNASQRKIADRLQRAMLPLELPKRGDVTFFTAYRPATDETLVGGDWYDAFEMDAGTLGFSIGDVTGHGLDAAVAMIETRLAIRSAASATDAPAELLQFVNHLLARDSSVATATAVVGTYDPDTRVAHYACAGHPAPVYVAADRRVIALPGGGLPLGTTENIESHDWMLTVDPGASLVFFTDGLLEYDRDILEGERRLLEALGKERVVSASDPAAVLYDTILHGKRNRDDVAVLVLRSSERFSDELSLTYSPAPRFAALARSALTNAMRRWDLEAKTISEVLMAGGEAIANAIEHGHYDDPTAALSIRLQCDDTELRLIVESGGHWKRSAARDDRGFGIRIMRAMTADVSFATTSRTTIARLKFALPPTKRVSTG